MAIDFSFPEETQHLIAKVREFLDTVVRPAEEKIDSAPVAPAAGDLPL